MFSNGAPFSSDGKVNYFFLLLKVKADYDIDLQ